MANPTVVPIQLTPLSLDEALAAAGGINARHSNLRQSGSTATARSIRSRSRNTCAAEICRKRVWSMATASLSTQNSSLEKAQAYFQEQITLAQFRQQGRVQALAELNAEVNLRRAALNEARSNFKDRVDFDAVDRDYVYLTGEVTKPGRFTMPFGRQATLADAIYSKSGFSSETGNPSQIYVLRGSSNPADFGAVTAWHLDARQRRQHDAGHAIQDAAQRYCLYRRTADHPLEPRFPPDLPAADQHSQRRKQLIAGRSIRFA